MTTAQTNTYKRRQELNYNLENYMCVHCGGTACAEGGRIRVTHKQYCPRLKWMRQEFPLLMKMIQKGRK